MATDPVTTRGADFNAGFYAGLYAAALSAETLAHATETTKAEILKAFAVMLRNDAKLLAKHNQESHG